ncbi:cell division ATP-binding protein FtsE [Patescibacteria group bacterium]|nr:cell division ATP-binding protein FtsE [Patescibacteria group bacterium]
MLSLKNVTKTFGTIHAIEGVSFDVADGEFVFLTGPSGAGKTTILRMILRDLLPDKGEILFEGKDITKFADRDIPKLRQKIGVVFQDFKVLLERTVSENVEIALAVIGLPDKEWDIRVKHVLKLVGILDRADFFPSQLSGGELQRVSMARALVVNPEIILADEPTGNLDWDTANELMKLFEEVNKEGKSIIMATHHRVIVDTMKKRVIEIDKGKVVGRKEAKKGKVKAKKTIK